MTELEQYDLLVPAKTSSASGAPFEQTTSSGSEDAASVGDDARLRILHIFRDRREVAVLDVAKKGGWPFVTRLDDLEEDVRSGIYDVEKWEPPLQPELSISEARRRARDANWPIIADFVENHEVAYSKPARCDFVAKALMIHGVSRPTLLNWLQRYWRRGMKPNALLPDFDERGGTGEIRGPTTAHRGRPPRGRPPTMNVDEEIRKSFSQALSLFWAQNKRIDFNGAYLLCLHKFFVDIVIDETGKKQIVPKEKYRKTGYPSKAQFIYWAKKDLLFNRAKQKRILKRLWDMQNRPLLDTAAANAPWPTARYEIDSTTLDLNACATRNRFWVLGRPTLYVIIDVYSRMIVGYFISFDPPSYSNAITALVNAAEPKREFCAKFGIRIDDEEWPSQHLCSNLLADRGELESNKIIPWLSTFNINVENTAPYRADWKGVVESRFRILHHGIRPFVPGSVDKNSKNRGEPDTRLDAIINLEELNQIIIGLILHHNNFHVLEGYDRSIGMTKAGVASIPREIWNWGIKALAGGGPTPRAEDVRFALLPRKKGSITPNGIKFGKLYYKCTDPLVVRIFSRSRTEGRFEASFAYDPRNTNYIYLEIDKYLTSSMKKERRQFKLRTDYLVCEIGQHSRSYVGLSAAELDLMLKAEEKIHHDRAKKAVENYVITIDDTQDILEAATAELPQRGGKQKSRIKGMKRHREEEREIRRNEASEEFAGVLRENRPSIDKVEVKRSTVSNIDLPPISDLKRRAMSS